MGSKSKQVYIKTAIKVTNYTVYFPKAKKINQIYGTPLNAI
jgi:hypothetical protein